MHRSKLAAAFSLAFALSLAAAVLLSVHPAVAAPLAHAAARGFVPHALLAHVAHASLSLTALRAKEVDLVARAAAKFAEITDGLAPEAVRAIETEHGTLVTEVEGVRREIAAAERTVLLGPTTAQRNTDLDKIRTAETARIQGILQVSRRANVAHDVAERAIAENISLDRFRELVIDGMAEGQERAAPGHQPGASDATHRIYAEATTPLPKGTNATRAMLALAATRGDRASAAAFVSRSYGRSADLVARALSTSIGSAGGFLLPQDMSTEVIELLRPASAVMALDPMIVPMPNGNMAIPRLAGGAAANYVGENQPAPASQPNFGMVQLSAKKLIALVPISNDMIKYPSISVDGIVRNDMVLSIATRADLAFIRGQGTQFSPRGLKSFAADLSLGGANIIPASTTVSLANITQDCGKAELALMQANIKMTKPGWIMAPRTQVFLMNIRDGLGNQVYAAEMAQGRFRGKPYKTTTQVPVNLAGTDAGNNATTDASELYLADFAEVIVGEAFGLELEVFNGATYIDGNGQLQSGVSNDQTVMRAIVQHDMNLRQIAAVVVLTNVRWF